MFENDINDKVDEYSKQKELIVIVDLNRPAILDHIKKSSLVSLVLLEFLIRLFLKAYMEVSILLENYHLKYPLQWKKFSIKKRIYQMIQLILHMNLVMELATNILPFNKKNRRIYTISRHSIWSIIKNMPKMNVRRYRSYFCSSHTITIIRQLINRTINRFCK